MGTDDRSETQLKGRHADQTLLVFFPCGDLQAASYTPADVFWGQLAGLLEALDAGTTTIVDHAHVNYSPEHCTLHAIIKPCQVTDLLLIQ